MNSRTLIMLAVAALVIVIAVKMNRNPDVDQTDTVAEPAITDTTTGTTDDYVAEEGVVVEEKAADEPAAEQMQEPTEPAVEGTTETAPAEGTDAMSDAETMTPAGEQTETTVGGKPVSEGETGALEPATVDEAPAEAVETAPAENVAEEPVAPREAAPATE